jgi:hypothetical protein
MIGKEIQRLQTEKKKETIAEKKKKIQTNINKSEKELIFYREIEKYLEHNPREQFCKDEKERLERIVNAAEASWNEHYQSNREGFDKLPMKAITARKATFLKEIDMALMRNQIKTLNFILL